MQFLCTALNLLALKGNSISKQGTVSLARAVQSKPVASVAFHLVNLETCVR